MALHVFMHEWLKEINEATERKKLKREFKNRKGRGERRERWEKERARERRKRDVRKKKRVDTSESLACPHMSIEIDNKGEIDLKTKY